MARVVSEDGTRRQKKWCQIDPWVELIPKSAGGIFFIFCLHPKLNKKASIYGPCRKKIFTYFGALKDSKCLCGCVVNVSHISQARFESGMPC